MFNQMKGKKMKTEYKTRIKNMIIKRYGFLDKEAFSLYSNAFEEALIADGNKKNLPEHITKDWQSAEELLAIDENNVDQIYA